MDGPHVVPDIDDGYQPLCDQCTSSHADVSAFSRTNSNALTVKMAEVRERNGRCGTCGIQTHMCDHQPGNSSNFGSLIPLTIANEVLRGRCLLCHPLPDRFRGFQFLNQGPLSSTSTRRTGISSTSCATTGTPGTCEDPGCSEYTFSGCSPPELVDMLYAMKRYPDSEYIQELGCEALWVQSWEDETSRIIGNVGGIDRIFDAMARFPNNCRLVICACEAIQNLALTACNRKYIFDNGGAALIVQAMMKHIASIGIQRSCCCTLISIATSRERRSHFLRVGAGIALVTSLGTYPNDPIIKCYALRALGAL